MTTLTKESIQTVKLDLFMGFVACIVRTQGYVNSKEASEKGIDSTGQVAWEWAIKGRPVALRNVTLLPEDRAIGKAAATWMKEGIDPTKYVGNDYIMHIHMIGDIGLATEKSMNYAASALQAMERDLKQTRENNPKHPVNADKFLGVIGEKIKIQAIYEGSSQFNSKFGLCYKYIFRLADGKKLSWLTGTELTIIQQGHTYMVSARVKKHTNFKGNCETEITRASIIS